MASTRSNGTRINRTIELLEGGQPIYYVGGHTGLAGTFHRRPKGALTGQHTPVLTYEQGQTDAGHWADYINVGFEHGSFNVAGLDDYLHGMVDAGPTRSGHRTPTIIVEAPVNGTSRAVVEANAWQCQQLLARGAHGVILCKANTPDAVAAFVEACRYPINRLGVGTGLGTGMRGIASEDSAGHVWGVDADTYIEKADPWPLNPDGELFLGIKIESKAALPYVEEIMQVPGVGFAEVGPGDMALTLGIRTLSDPWPQEMVEIEQRVKEACEAGGVYFHPFTGYAAPADFPALIDAGALVITAPDQEIARIGRAHTKRAMPV